MQSVRRSHPCAAQARLCLCTVVPAMDLLIYIFVYSNPDTSYSAHGGGIVAGFLLGLALLNPVADTRCHSYGVKPLAALLLLAYAVFAFGWEQTMYPPEYLYNGEPWKASSWGKADTAASCCWQLQDCPDVDERYYKYFNCDNDKDLFISLATDDAQLDYKLGTCDALSTALDAALKLKALIDDDDR